MYLTKIEKVNQCNILFYKFTFEDPFWDIPSRCFVIPKPREYSFHLDENGLTMTHWIDPGRDLFIEKFELLHKVAEKLLKMGKMK